MKRVRETRDGAGLAALVRTLVVAAVMLASTVSATSYLELTLDEMIQRAEIAVFAEVVAVTSEERSGEPWSVVTFAIIRDLMPAQAGSDPEAESEPIELAFLGGSIDGGPVLTVELMPTFEPGERVLLLAYRQDYASPIVGFRQGLWREGALGLVDETDRSLSLDGAGELVLDGEGAATEALLLALETRLGTSP